MSGYFFLGAVEHKSFAALNSILCREILIDTCASSISEDVAAKSVTLDSFNFFSYFLPGTKYINNIFYNIFLIELDFIFFTYF